MSEKKWCKRCGGYNDELARRCVHCGFKEFVYDKIKEKENELRDKI